MSCCNCSAAGKATGGVGEDETGDDDSHDDTSSLEPLSVLQLMLQEIEADFTNLNTDGRTLRTPSGFDSLGADIQNIPIPPTPPRFGRPLRFRPGVASLDVLGGIRFDDFDNEEEGEDSGDDVEILKY